MMPLRFVALLIVAGAACGGEVSTVPTTSAGGSAGGPTGAGGLTGAGGAVQGGGGSTSSGDLCSASEPCLSGSCAYAQGSCASDATGTCIQGFTCDGPPTGPLCRCDGSVLEDPHAICAQWAAGAPFDDPGPCATGTFVCGSLQCTRHVEVCVVTHPGMPGPEEYACVPLSQLAGSCAHGIADCSCMDLSPVYCDAGGACDCASNEDGQETVTVYLP